MREATPGARILPATLSPQGLLLGAVLSWSLAAGALYYETVASMVAIWWRSQTFAHGFLILPISLWLVWRRRRQLAALPVNPALRVLPLVALCGAIWLVARRVDVVVVQQLAFVAMFVSGVWAMAGTTLTRAMAFPLAFLFLAVPMGAGLIPPLMELTADTTEYLLRASGIPVYRQGMHLSLPTGNWSVIEECSGVRYLVASFTLGLVYAWLTYRRWWRRALFVAAAIAAPVAANSLRAYLVVILGHTSDMRFGTGDDHLLLGWVIFGLVMLALFWLGGYWQEPESVAVSGKATAPGGHGQSGKVSTCALLAVLCALVWPLLGSATHESREAGQHLPLATPRPADDWRIDEGQLWAWRPPAPGADRSADGLYQHLRAGGEDQRVGLFLRQYLSQRQGAELVGSGDIWRPDRHQWRVVREGDYTVGLSSPLRLREALVVSPGQRLLIWHWYRVDSRHTANPYLAKALEARQLVLRGERLGTRIYLAIPVAAEPDLVAARAGLRTFLEQHLERIDAVLATGTDPDTSQRQAGRE